MSNLDSTTLAVQPTASAAEMAAKLLLGLEERLLPSSIAESLMKCYMDPQFEQAQK